jgi:hypothetical protein
MRELRLRRWLVGGVLAAFAAAGAWTVQVSYVSGEWEWNEVTVEAPQEAPVLEESTESEIDTETHNLAREEEWEWN